LQLICRCDTHTAQESGSLVPCSDELAVQSRPLLCLLWQVAKLASGLFYCCSLLCHNNMATNLLRFTSCYDSGRFAACNCWTQIFWLVHATKQWLLIAVSHAFVYCGKKHEFICSSASTSLKNPLQTRLSAVHNDNDIGLYVNSAKAITNDRSTPFWKTRIHLHLNTRIRFQKGCKWSTCFPPRVVKPVFTVTCIFPALKRALCKYCVIFPQPVHRD